MNDAPSTATKTNSLPVEAAAASVVRPHALPPLNTDDAALLARLERQLASGKTPSATVATAVATIKHKGLARLHQLTFQEYCSKHLRIKKSRVHQLLEFAELLAVTASSGSLSLAGNERQLRPLKGLPRAGWADAWADAVRTAPAGKITGKHVQAVVDSRLAQMRAAQAPAPAPASEEPPAKAVTPMPIPIVLDAGTSVPFTTSPPTPGASEFIRTVPAPDVPMPGWKPEWARMIRNASRPPGALTSSVFGWQAPD